MITAQQLFEDILDLFVALEPGCFSKGEQKRAGKNGSEYEGVIHIPESVLLDTDRNLTILLRTNNTEIDLDGLDRLLQDHPSDKQISRVYYIARNHVDIAVQDIFSPNSLYKSEVYPHVRVMTIGQIYTILLKLTPYFNQFTTKFFLLDYLTQNSNNISINSLWFELSVSHHANDRLLIDQLIEERLEWPSTVCLAIEGEPGSGKSWTLRRFTERLIRQFQNDNLGRARIPIFVPMTLQPENRDLDLFDISRAWAEQLSGVPEIERPHLFRYPIFRYLRKHHRIVVLLDGLDEAVQKYGSERTTSLLREVTQLLMPEGKFIISTRPQARHLLDNAFWDRQDALRVYKINPLAERQVGEFLVSREEAYAIPLDDFDINQFRDNTNHLPIAFRSPLYLDLIARAGGDIGQVSSEGEIIRVVCEKLIENELSQRAHPMFQNFGVVWEWLKSFAWNGQMSDLNQSFVVNTDDELAYEKLWMYFPIVANISTDGHKVDLLFTHKSISDYMISTMLVDILRKLRPLPEDLTDTEMQPILFQKFRDVNIYGFVRQQIDILRDGVKLLGWITQSNMDFLSALSIHILSRPSLIVWEHEGFVPGFRTQVISQFVNTIDQDHFTIDNNFPLYWEYMIGLAYLYREQIDIEDYREYLHSYTSYCLELPVGLTAAQKDEAIKLRKERLQRHIEYEREYTGKDATDARAHALNGLTGDDKLRLPLAPLHLITLVGLALDVTANLKQVIISDLEHVTKRLFGSQDNRLLYLRKWLDLAKGAMTW